MKAFKIIDIENEMKFAFAVSDKDYTNAIEIAKRGLSYWYISVNVYDYIDEPGYAEAIAKDGLTFEDIEDFEPLGYAEPSEELLKYHGIDYKFINPEDEPLYDIENIFY